MEPLLKPAVLRNILALRGLSTTSTGTQSSFAENRVLKNKARCGQRRFVSTKDAPARPETAADSAHLPLFLRSFEYPQKTAVCGLEEDVQHGEALRRSELASPLFLAVAASILLQEPPLGKGDIGRAQVECGRVFARRLRRDQRSVRPGVPLRDLAQRERRSPRGQRSRVRRRPERRRVQAHHCHRFGIREQGRFFEVLLVFVHHIPSYCRSFQVEKNSMAKVLVYNEVEGTSSTKNTHFEVSDLRHTIKDNYYAENQEALLLYSKGSDHLV